MNPEKVEVYWYVAINPADIGYPELTDTKRSLLYFDAAGWEGSCWRRDASHATGYRSRREATDAALLLAAARPQFLGKVRVKMKKRVWYPAPGGS